MRTAKLTAAACLFMALCAAPARAQCPKITISVDNDIPGSGYSEVKPKNWLSNSVGSCHKNYRYLSHTVGDGTRKGKAIWKPKITVTGWYEVKTSYRATSNRTTDADYYLHDDNGGKKKVVINQKHSGDCTKKVLGTIYCKKGGSCRLVLDGDDGQSDAADITTFLLTKCSGTPPKNPCSGISAKSAYEVCNWTATTCAGTYNNSDGCKKYCAAAGMICVARFGGEPGCKKEPANKIACNAVNTHKSDWCECKGLVKPDAGPPPDSKPPKKDTQPPSKDSKPPKKDTQPPKKDGKPPKKDGKPPKTDGEPAKPDTKAAADGPAGQDSSADGTVDGRISASSCDCEVGDRHSAPWALLLLAGLALRWRRRR